MKIGRALCTWVKDKQTDGVKVPDTRGITLYPVCRSRILCSPPIRLSICTTYMHSIYTHAYLYVLLRPSVITCLSCFMYVQPFTHESWFSKYSNQSYNVVTDLPTSIHTYTAA
jgi:hypothetical protein